MIKKNTKNGFIAMTSVLVLGAIFLVLILGVTSQSVNLLQHTISVQHADAAKQYAYSCAEYALLQATQQLHYTGNQMLSFEDETCEILPVAEDVDGSSTIRTQSTVKGYVHRVVVEVVNIYPHVEVQSYQSVLVF